MRRRAYRLNDGWLPFLPLLTPWASDLGRTHRKQRSQHADGGLQGQGRPARGQGPQQATQATAWNSTARLSTDRTDRTNASTGWQVRMASTAVSGPGRREPHVGGSTPSARGHGGPRLSLQRVSQSWVQATFSRERCDRRLRPLTPSKMVSWLAGMPGPISDGDAVESGS